MSKKKQLNERLNKIRKLQERQKKSAEGAIDQASELDDILAVSRAEHEGTDPDRPLRSASDLMGPGGAQRRSARTTVDTESAYARNLAAAHFASPEAFSRNRNKPPAILGPGATGIGAGLRPQPIKSIQRPAAAEESKSEPAAEAEMPRIREKQAPIQLEANDLETTLVVRRRKAGALRGNAPAPLEGAPTETLVMRERKIPKEAINDRGEVVPTDHIVTAPGTAGMEKRELGSQHHNSRSLQAPVPPTDHVATLPGAGGGKVDPTGETLVGLDARPMPNVSVRKPGEVLPTDHVGTAPGTAGLQRVTKSERTEVIRRRRLHPDAVDPESGDVLPTDHVVTAPGMAGLSAPSSDRTMPRIDVRNRSLHAPDPMAHGETIPIERSAALGEAPASRLAGEERKTPEKEGPESTMVVRKRKTPRDG